MVWEFIGGFNTRRYTLVQGFCFFKLFFVGPTELNFPYKFPFAYGETMTMMTPYGVIGWVGVKSGSTLLPLPVGGSRGPDSRDSAVHHRLRAAGSDDCSGTAVDTDHSNLEGSPGTAGEKR